MEFGLNKYKNASKPEDLATRRYFEEYPESKWEWTYDFLDLIENHKPNEGHKAILKLQEHWALNGIKWSLVTQNIDDYHWQLILNSSILKTTQHEEGKPGFGFTDHVYEIHGNLRYVRWYDEWDQLLYYTPPKSDDPDQIIPKCTKCGSKMRPNVLWFDESYTEELHRVKTVSNFLPSKEDKEGTEENPKVDALIVVGTALATTLANKIVNTWLLHDILTIEVNLEPVCEEGHVIQVLTKSEISLPQMIDRHNFITKYFLNQYYIQFSS